MNDAGLEGILLKLTGLDESIKGIKYRLADILKGNARVECLLYYQRLIDLVNILVELDCGRETARRELYAMHTTWRKVTNFVDFDMGVLELNFFLNYYDKLAAGREGR